MTAPRRLQLRRGNSTAISTYTGAAGEVVIDTTNWILYVHDGSTVGGYATTTNVASITGNITQSNLGLKGYVDLANTIQSQQISAANLGMKGYVDSVASQSIYGNANVAAYLHTYNYSPYSNVNVAVYTNLSTYAYNANVTAANLGLKGYVDLANTIQSQQISDANLSMKGYVDSVASQSIYDNSNVKSYLSGGFDANIIPAGNAVYSLGSITNQWRDLYVSNNTIYIGGIAVSTTGGTLTVGGNTIAGTNLVTYSGNVSASAISLDGATGAIGTVAVVNPGNGFAPLTFYNTTGGSGNGGTIYYTLAYDPPFTLNNRGTGYRVGDIITVINDTVGNGYSNASIVVTSLQNQPAPSIFVGNSAYRFGADGNIVLPAGGGILDSSGVSVLGTGGTNYSNSNVASYLIAESYAKTSDITTANLGLKGYVDQANTIQSQQITSANVGMKGYVDSQSFYSNTKVATYLASHTDQSFGGNVTISGNLTVNGNVTYINVNNFTTNDNIINLADLNPADTLDLGFSAHRTVNFTLQHTGLVRDASDNQWKLFSNITAQPGTTVDFTDAVYDDIQLGNITSPTIDTLTLANTIQSQQLAAANIGIIGYIDQGNTIQAAAITAANVGLKGYVDFANTVMKAYVDGQITAANTNVSGGGSNYGNANVASYLITNGYVNTNSAYANSNVTAYTVSMGFTNYSNVNAKAYTESMGFQNYGNTNVIAYLNATGYNLYSNVNVASYLSTATINTTGNITAAWLSGNISVFGNVVGNSANVTIQAGNYISVFDNQGNVRLPNAYVSGNVVSTYFIGNGSQLTGLPSSYSNVQVAAYLNATGYNLYSNANVASYLPLYGGDISARNITVSGNIALTGNVLQINSAIFYGNTITGFSALYAGIPGYTPIPQVVAQFTSDFNGYAQINSQNLGTGNQASSDFIATANNGTDSAYFVDFGIAGSGYDPSVAANNNAIGTALTPNDAYLYTAGNTAANGGGNLVIGVQTLNKNIRFFAGGVNANNVVLTIQGNGISTAGNVTGTYFIGSGQFLSGLPTAYSNVNVKAYTESMGYQNYGNVNVKAYAESMGYQNYGNVNVVAYLNATGYNLYSNVNVIAYLAGNITAGNVTATYFTGNGAFLTGLASSYSNVQVATYLPTYTGVVTASNVAVAGNVTAQYLFGNGALLTGIVAASSYSNVQVATYLPTYSGNIANIRLGVAGVLTFADGTTQTTAATGSYSNIQVATYLPTYTGSINASNILVTGANITLANIQATTAATNTATGALRVMGGVGVAGSLFAGQLNTTGNLVANTVSVYGINVVANILASAVRAGTINSTGNVLAQSIIGTIATASQPSITEIGTLATLSVTGNATVGNLIGTEANTRIIANVYTTTFDIYGNVSFPGNVNVAGLGVVMPARPAFRVNGTAAPITTANVNLKGSAITTVFNQGNYLDTTTGTFTAPIAGIYEVLLNARVGSYNGLSQIAVLKNGNNSQGNIVCFWEIGSTTGTANHFGVSGTVQLAVGEYLSANILAGNVSFDGNDNWCVTYLG